MKTKYVMLFESWNRSWQSDQGLIDSILQFVFDDSGEGLWFQDMDAIIDAANSHPDLVAESIEWIEASGGKIWRGSKHGAVDDVDQTEYTLGLHKKLESFTTNKETALQFSGDDYMVEADIDQVRDNVVLAVPVLLKDVELPEWIGYLDEWWQTDDWRSEAKKFIEDQAEVLVKGPLTLPIHRVNSGMVERVSSIKRLLAGLGQMHQSNPSSLIFSNDEAWLSVGAYDVSPEHAKTVATNSINRGKRHVFANETRMLIIDDTLQVTQVDLSNTSPSEWAGRVAKEVTGQ